MKVDMALPTEKVLSLEDVQTDGFRGLILHGLRQAQAHRVITSAFLHDLLNCPVVSAGDVDLAIKCLGRGLIRQALEAKAGRRSCSQKLFAKQAEGTT